MHPVDLFLSASRAHRDKVAISANGQNVSYGELETRVRALAGVFSGYRAERIMIALGPSVDAYAAIFASLLVGATHTPVNTTSPIRKLQRIASLLEPTIIVSEGQLAADLSHAFPSAAIVRPSDISMDAAAFEGNGKRNDRAYVMFTSGSTGDPKGVMVPAIAITRYVEWLATIGYRPGDRVSQQPNLGFDISMTDIFGALCYGATLVPLMSEADRLAPAKFIKRQQITVWNSTPSAVGLMMTGRQLTSENIATLRLVNFCGEPLMKEILEGLFAARPDLIVNNTYGPTEAAVAVTCQRLTQANYAQHARASIGIGEPFASVQLHLLNGSNNEGELAISGDQLAEGYWKDATKTEMAFQHIEVDGQEVRAYLTGDWVERCDGQIYFKDRIDFQVKVKGHRVELDEVASAIRSLGWPLVSVFKRGDALAAVVETVKGQPFDEKVARSRLKDSLDTYAIPVRILETERLPRNDNDKIDRRAAAEEFEQMVKK